MEDKVCWRRRPRWDEVWRTANVGGVRVLMSNSGEGSRSSGSSRCLGRKGKELQSFPSSDSVFITTYIIIDD